MCNYLGNLFDWENDQLGANELRMDLQQAIRVLAFRGYSHRRLPRDWWGSSFEGYVLCDGGYKVYHCADRDGRAVQPFSGLQSDHRRVAYEGARWDAIISLAV